MLKKTNCKSEIMISYAQNFEDVILERFFKNIEKGFYVDVGAAGPALHSVTKHFYDKGWQGINIEPSLSLFNDLIIERGRDINLNLVVSDQDGLIEFFDLANTGLSSIMEQNVKTAISNENLRDYNNNKFEEAKSILVESRKLSGILSQYAPNIEIDFLKIDVEGAEREVIKSNNWARFRPKVILIEATIPNSTTQNYSEWEKLIIEAEYAFVYFDGINRFYLRNDLLKYKDVFSYPPCYFDAFTLFTEVKKQIKISELQSLCHQLQSRQKELQSQHKELQSQHGELQSQHGEFQSQHKELQSQHKELQSQYEELQSHHHQLQTQYQDLQAFNIIITSSLSWRLTFPLRFIKKAGKRLLNKIKIPGMISTLKIVIEFIVIRVYSRLKKNQSRPGKVLFDVSAPREAVVRPEANEVIVEGWCFMKEQGQLPVKVLVQVNERFYECKPQERPDVVSHFSVQYPKLAMNTGFKGTIIVPKGLYLIKVIAVFKEIGPVKMADKLLWINTETIKLSVPPSFEYPELKDSNLSKTAQKIYIELKKANNNLNISAHKVIAISDDADEGVQVLDDDSCRTSSDGHEIENAQNIKWDESVQQALLAIKNWRLQQYDKKTTEPTSATLPKLAFVSPLPPARSGISDYSAELLPELANYYNIDVVVDQASIGDPWIKSNCSIRSYDWFKDN
nr:FkbM family methyltransferase [Bacteroidota bacterium]